MGDGTYFHSGSLALEACVAAGVNITYKILYNGTVAMTGGQDAVGALPMPALTRKLEAEGVRRSVVLPRTLHKYNGIADALARTAVHGRDELPKVMRELEKTPGVTVMIYDQECAAEKRRERSRGKLAEPTERLVIHEEVCEGCGDCVQAVELHEPASGGDGARREDAHPPVVLQQGLHVRARRLPVVRHGGAEAGTGLRSEGVARTCRRPKSRHRCEGCPRPAAIRS